MKRNTEDPADEFENIHTSMTEAQSDVDTAIRVEKRNKITQIDENTPGRLLPDAPDFAREFIGIVYRVNNSSSEFESFC